ncbi:MAG: hypothetical protein IJ773_04030 [Lachnospiraceae bacterium]|nr:hypothetical protein [Lachnospiraceae bacterium]
MKKNIRYVVYVVSFLLILSVCLLALGEIFRPRVTSDPSMIRDEVDARILTTPENTTDILLMGNSEMLAHVSPVTLWEEEGIASLNLGSVGQFFYLVKGYLKLAMETQSPRLVILDMDALFLWEVRGENYMIHRVADFFPILRNHDRWKEPYRDKLLLTDAEKKKAGKDKDRIEKTRKLKGYYYSTENCPAADFDYMQPVSDGEPVISWNRLAFQDIVAFCKKKNVPLLLVSTPSIKNWNDAKHETVQILADENNLPYLDLNLYVDELQINWETDSRDGGDHLNDKGTQKVSRFLAGYLKEHYDLPDRRGDKHYAETYEEAAAYYHELVGQKAAGVTG